MLDKELTDGRQVEDPLPIESFSFEEEIFCKFLKFEVVSWYGVGGGLQYFDFIKGEGKAIGNGS